MTAQEIQKIVLKMRDFYHSGATRGYEFRIKQLETLEKGVKAYEKAFCDALKKDLNKAPQETYLTEIGMILEEIRCHKRHLKRWMRRKILSFSPAHFPCIGYDEPEPYGTALIVSPWNYPLNLCLIPLAGAISGGNCAVIKPSAYAPETSHVLKKMVEEFFAPDYICVIEGGRQENTALFEQPFDYIFFTGSPSVGQIVMEKAAAHLTPVTLELGGKSPVVIDSSADLELAARKIAFGKVLNAGQTCIEPDYLLIPPDLEKPFIHYFNQAIHEFFPGGNFDDMPHIVNRKHFDRLCGLMGSGEIALGGKTNPETLFIEPTILRNVTPDSPVMSEEIFGPILPVLTYNTRQEAVQMILSRPRPLAFYLFARDKSVWDFYLQRISFGGGAINDVISHVSSSKMPFGGVGASGMGSYHGKKSFETFTHRRSVLKTNSHLDMPLRYHPYTPVKERLARLYLGHEK